MTTEKHDPWALLREARDFVALDAEAAGSSRFASEDERVSGLLARIDAALAEHDAKPTLTGIEWREKESNRYGVSPHEADYSDNVFLTVEKHWLGEQWLFRVEYVGEAENEAEAKAAAIAAARGMK